MDFDGDSSDDVFGAVSEVVARSGVSTARVGRHRMAAERRIRNGLMKDVWWVWMH